jgi:hypothetical protein
MHPILFSAHLTRFAASSMLLTHALQLCLNIVEPGLSLSLASDCEYHNGYDDSNGAHH